MIHFACPRCQSSFQVPDSQVGRKASCPRCQQRLQVPRPQANRTVLGVPVAQVVTAPRSAEPAPFDFSPPRDDFGESLPCAADRRRDPGSGFDGLGVCSLCLAVASGLMLLIPVVGWLTLPLAGVGTLLGFLGLLSAGRRRLSAAPALLGLLGSLCVGAFMCYRLAWLHLAINRFLREL